MPNSPLSKEPSMRRPRLLWHNILFMTLTPIAAAILTPWYFMNNEFSWGLIPFFLICYSISNMSITCGYHRYFAHRSYSAHPIVDFLYILIGSGAFQGSALQWSTDHRRHHLKVDSNEDPYTIKKGFWHAHVLWMFREDQHPDSKKYPKDLTSNRWLMLQHNYYVFFAVFMGFIVPGLVGWALGLGFWGGLLIGGLLRIVLTQHSTFLINSAAHTFGRQTYTDRNSAKDSLIMAFLTFGEGYHNFHHYFQADYRNGIRWYQWDPTKWWIRSLAFFGLASRLKRTKKEDILKARLAMEERLMLAKGASVERVQQLKLQIVEAQNRLRQLREDYVAAKRSLQERGREKLLTMKAELKIARIEFRSAYGQWRILRRTHRAAKQIAA